MKILITGSSGMVGKNLASSLKGYELLLPTSKELNLLDKDKVFSYLKEKNPELIIHCAGKVGGIQANIKQPTAFFVENLLMGQNLILSARELEIKKVINLGSSCMYPRDFKNPLKEEYILQGELEPTNEGYALAKIAVAKLCEYISKEDSSFLYKTLIPCNLYGYYDKFSPENSHMIPAVIRKIHEAKESNLSTVEIWGDGTAKREFMFTQDLCDFISEAISKIDNLPQYLNVGLGYDYSINEYYSEIARVIGFSGEFDHDLTKPVGMKQKVVDTTNLKKFGFTAKTSLREGIEKTYNYFLNEELNE